MLAVRTISLLAFAFCAAVFSASEAAARVWTDATGSFQIEAELISTNAIAVLLETTDGRRITVPLTQLSRQDRRFLADQQRAAATPMAPVSEPPGEPSANGPQFGEPVALTIVKGVRIKTPGGARGVTATFPAPAAWPEQSVELIDASQPASVQRVSDRELPGGSKQVVLSIPNMRAGEEAAIEMTYRVMRKPILPPEDPSGLTRPRRPQGDLRQYLGASPGIQTSNTRFRKTAEELAADGAEGWQLVAKTFDWVRANLKYVGGDLRGALWAAEHGQGDCEEYTSLFIALARANGIPARAVWVPGHCYAEFYLEDQTGRGYWFPCDALQEETPGRLTRLLPILQKGDSFDVPELRGKQRYLQEALTARDIGRGAPPTLEAILRNEASAPME